MFLDQSFCVRAIFLSLIFCFGWIGLKSGSIEARQDQIEAKAKDQAQQY